MTKPLRSVNETLSSGAAGGGQRAELGIDESSPLTAILQLGTWIPFQGNAILFPLMAVVGLAIMVYFMREARDGFHWWKTFLAPIRERRAHFEAKPGLVEEVIAEGSRRARQEAEETIRMARDAMGINYFASERPDMAGARRA